ncbi:hypothetical protein BJ170DRAFT_680784 [Xylariales sp. AK1849]|nr:hypothetical protein BJ170DRAFT_680784 [Xylariales sp. AK1849]
MHGGPAPTGPTEKVVVERQCYPELVPVKGLDLLGPGSDKETTSNANEASEAISPDYDQSEQWKSAEFSRRTISNRKIGGTRRRLFFIVISAALLVIALVVGVTVGIVTKHKISSTGNGSEVAPGSSNNGSETALGNSNVLANSSLSAVNWTDTEGFNHRMLIFQDPYNSIISRRWDSQNNTWATTNVSMVLSNSPSPVDVPAGTSLAAAAWDTQVDLFMIDRNGRIVSLLCADCINSPNLWQNESMNDTLYTHPQSRLAATVQLCGDGDTLCSCSSDRCAAGWVVAFQHPDDGTNITTNYSSAWTGRQSAVVDNIVTASTSLVLITEYQGTHDGLGLVTQRYVSGTEGAIEVSAYTDHKWNDSNPISVMTNIPASGLLQHAVASKWRDWATTLSYVLLDDGTLKGSWWTNDTNTPLDTITMDGGPANVSNISYIAMTLDAMLYAISDDEILEYSVDDTDPSTLHYVGKIFP